MYGDLKDDGPGKTGNEEDEDTTGMTFRKEGLDEVVPQEVDGPAEVVALFGTGMKVWL